MPVQPGLFLGPTVYNDWYWHNLILARDQLRKVLDSTDFDQQTILYHCGW